MIKTIGDFEINVWESGHPVWCQLIYKPDNCLIKLSHQELSDLKYAVEEMIKAVRNALPDNYKHEV